VSFWGGAGTAEDIEREETDDGVIERGGRLPCGVWVEILSPRVLRELYGGECWQRKGLLLRSLVVHSLEE
jgi:hypothetical protein